MYFKLNTKTWAKNAAAFQCWAKNTNNKSQSHVLNLLQKKKGRATSAYYIYYILAANKPA